MTSAPGTPMRAPARVVARCVSDPPSPVTGKLNRRRLLERHASEPKTSDTKRVRRSVAWKTNVFAEAGKTTTQEVHQPTGDVAEFLRHGLDDRQTRTNLAPVLDRWGSARTQQVLDLWTFLGDGIRRKQPSVSALQVWGPAGTGKSAVLDDYLRTVGIRHCRLDCACFLSIGELQARLAEELRCCALFAAMKAATSAKPKVKDLQRPWSGGRQLRAIDRLDAAMLPSLEALTEFGGEDGDRVVVVFDQAQELTRLSPEAPDRLASLPHCVRRGRQLTFVFVSRLPLSDLGVLPNREPAAVAFPAYTPAETEDALVRALSRGVASDVGLNNLPTHAEIRSLCTSGLMKFAAPFLGNNMHSLLRIGQEILSRAGVRGASIQDLQQQVDVLVMQRLSLPGLEGLLQETDGTSDDVSSTAAMRGLTKSEKFMLLTAYFGSRIGRDDDRQLFTATGCRRRFRKRVNTAASKASGEASSLRAPMLVSLTRLLAIHHRLTRNAHLVGPPLLECLMGLKEAGFVRFSSDRAASLDQDPKIICRIEAPLAHACANELNVDVSEFLTG